MYHLAIGALALAFALFGEIVAVGLIGHPFDLVGTVFSFAASYLVIWNLLNRAAARALGEEEAEQK